MFTFEQLIDGVKRKKEDIFLQYGRLSSDRMLIVMRKDDMHELFKLHYQNRHTPHLTLTPGYMLKIMDIKVITAPEALLKERLFMLTVVV
ncbi:Uncharacterised protein [Leminorella richardii]|uniref:Uncharacterized protein n=1 Tax=Leminorella richardii TaxID=158841 RepID=A0A2X4UW46_9GAMM|nr:hypothetical protein [Leminorella richardii]SQI43031.1 Uncharacterised protein [Leminorella richardii]